MFPSVTRTAWAVSVAATIVISIIALLRGEPAPPSAPVATAERSQLAAPRALLFEQLSEAPPRYIGRDATFSLTLDALGAELALYSAAGAEHVRLSFPGAAPEPRITAPEADGGVVVHYYVGDDPAAWRSDVPLHRAVRYEQLYPGVDAVFYARNDAFEYDFVVAPGSDPAQIALAFDGALHVSLDADGSLLVQTDSGTLRQPAPVAYQQIEDERHDVSARYRIDADGRVHIALGDYDAAHELVIDPVLNFSTYFGGTKGDTATRVAVDGSGNVYVVGDTFSIDLPQTLPQPPLNTTPAAGDVQAFVAKYAPDGGLAWVAYVGGSAEDHGRDIAVTGDGSAYVTGETASSNFPSKSSARAFGGKTDAFVVVLGPNGSLNYAGLLGGTENDYGHGIAVGPQNRAYVAGETWSINFPTDPGTRGYSTTCGGCNTADTYDGFLVVLDPSTDTLDYATFLGGGSTDYAHAVAVNSSSGVAYVTGETLSSDFPVIQATAFQAKLGGASDAFIAALDPAKTGKASLLYSSFLGGSGEDLGVDVALNSTGRVYITGTTGSADLPTRNAFQTTLRGPADAFLAKFEAGAAGGLSLLLSTYYGGSGEDFGESVTTLGETAVVAGMTHSMDLPTLNPLSAMNAGNMDGFVAHFSNGGNLVQFASYFGGSGLDNLNGIAARPDGTLIVVGDTLSTDFQVTRSAPQSSTKGEQDAVMFTLSGTAGSTAPAPVQPSAGAVPAKSAGGALDVLWLLALLLVRRRRV